MPVTRLLVANRGEVAVRVRHTAAALGIPTVTVFATDDADTGHARSARDAGDGLAAVELPGAGPAAYLDAGALLDVARRTGCDAVHPGYGFLSESPAFASACADAGLTFVGPSPAALRLFGDKAAARARAEELGIDVLAGTPVLTGENPDADLALARAFVDEHGAAMVKAVAGGGGRGMRPVTAAGPAGAQRCAEQQGPEATAGEGGAQVCAEQQAPDTLSGVLERCRSEARGAFGDGSLYLERLLPRARHIEVQVLGDHTGAVVALGDRDCSAQRRRQKLVEIAPAPGLSGALRSRLRDAAIRLAGSVDRLGLATVEFLFDGERAVFLEVNPRLQVEHTVTEEVTGLDLVELQLRLAAGASLADLGLSGPGVAEGVPPLRGTAVQARVNAETVTASGEVRPGGGELLRFVPPTGRGIRVDTAAAAGTEVNPRYDSLLAKVIVTGPDLAAALAATARALARFDVAGPATNLSLLRALLRHPGLPEAHTAFVDEHLTELALPDDPAAEPEIPTDGDVLSAPLRGVVVELPAEVGDELAEGSPLAVLEAMKMEHVVPAPGPVVVRKVLVAVGEAVVEGDPLLVLEPAGSTAAEAGADDGPDLDLVRPDLAEALERHRIGLDEGRAEAVAKRHGQGRLTARENLELLCDPGTFLEYGALTVAAQRRRREMADLIARTPADGMVTGTAEIHGRRCAVMSYDYTVLAGTQGVQNHRKTDRLYALARREGLPVVIFAEGGGGRPGDTDQPGFTGLDVPTFHSAAAIVGEVPTVAVVGGYCFAGNAALAGVCDVLIAAEGSSIGMGGPAMIVGGGLGTVAPQDVGPLEMQVRNGVVDLPVPDDRAAVAAARRYLSYFPELVTDYECADQRTLRHLVPENRVRAYPVRPVLDALFDTGSVLELRAEFGVGILTAFARIEGHPVGVIANNPLHLGGAIDSEAADKVARFLPICDAYRLPIVSLCDTPGFMVGPDAERTGSVRRFGAMFVAGAQLDVPLAMVVLRKGYGLGAMAMAGGGLKETRLTVSWPTGEFGGMNLEGAVELGYRAELDAVADPVARRQRYEELVARAYEHGKALTTAATFDIDDVIDPAETRSVLARAFGW